MSIDTRTRLNKDIRTLERDEVFDSVLPGAIAVHGDVAGRGVLYKELPAIALDVDDRSVTLRESRGSLTISEGIDEAGVVARMSEDALSDLVQDVQSTMGLMMT